MSQIRDIIGASPANMSREELLAHLVALRKPRPDALKDVKTKTTKKKPATAGSALIAQAAKEGKTAGDAINDLFADMGV